MVGDRQTTVSVDDEDCALARDVAVAEAAAVRAGRAPQNYTELVPPLVTVADFLAANARSECRRKAVVVKFYSKQCRACLRIAAKYRRLALDLSEDVDCYEVESIAARPLVDALNVTKVPSVQIYDPGDIIRLANAPCMPDDFKQVTRKVHTAIAHAATLKF